jgi:hypothetical protein
MTPAQRRYRISRHRNALIRARHEIGELGCDLPDDLKAVADCVVHMYCALCRLIDVLEKARP